MERRGKIGFMRGAIMISMIVMHATHAYAVDCVRSVRWNDDPPFSSLGADRVVQGIYIDLVREALKRMDCTPKFVEMPWARAIVELEKGRLDILPGAYPTEERRQFALFSRPTSRSPNVLFLSKVAAAKYRIDKLADVIGTDFRLGTQIGVSYGSEFDALAKNPDFSARLVMLPLRRSAWKMIALGRLDGVIADESTGLVELQQLGLVNAILKSKVIVSRDASMVAFSKRSVTQDFVQRFNQSLNSLMVDGSYKQILERYVPCTASLENLGCK